jgi:multicomponent Na+:H+ antiporter subunit E
MTTGRHNSLGYSLLLNVLLAFLWQAFQPESTPTDFVVGAVVGFLVLAVMQREYGRRVWAAIAFALFLGYSIIASSLQVAALVLARRPQLDRGIIAIPLEASSDVEIAALATAITLTPGTISVDVSHRSGWAARALRAQPGDGRPGRGAQGDQTRLRAAHSALYA